MEPKPDPFFSGNLMKPWEDQHLAAGRGRRAAEGKGQCEGSWQPAVAYIDQRVLLGCLCVCV